MKTLRDILFPVAFLLITTVQAQSSAPSWRANQPDAYGALTLAPNPASERVQFIPSSTSDHLFVEVFDAAGQRMLQFELRGPTWIPIAELPAGMYIVRTSDHYGMLVATERLMVVNPADGEV